MFSLRRGGFEPRIPYEINGFRDRPVQPLWHLSEMCVGEVCEV